MDEAQRLADRVAIIAGGEVVARGTPEDLGDRESQPATITYRRGGEEVTLETTTPVKTLNELTGRGARRRARARGPRSEAAEPRGRLPGADRAGEPEDEPMSLVLHQFRYDQKAFWRNPASVFFTVMFPVMLLRDPRRRSSATRRSMPAAASRPRPTTCRRSSTLAIISATMQTLAMSLVIAREDGRLKRGRGTPMPAWVFIAGRIGNSIVVAAADARPAGRDRRHPLRRRRSPGSRLPAILPPSRRRRRLLLLPGDRPDRADPLAGRGGADRQRAPPAALLPLRRLHPRRRAAQRA